jgi:hypothetical protein
MGGNGLGHVASEVLGLLDELLLAALGKHGLRGSLSAEFLFD